MKFQNISSGFMGLLILVTLFLLLMIITNTIKNSNIYNQNIIFGNFQDKRRPVVFSQDFIPRSLHRNRDEHFDYQAVLNELNTQHTRMDDPRLIRIIRDYFIEPPSLKPYNLSNPERLEYSNGQTPFIDSRLNYIENGFYVECGALNGEKGSNTLFFEKVRKWNGILIEADPSNYAVLKTKQRKAFLIHACLSPHPYPKKMTFNKAFNRGRVVHDSSVSRWIKHQNIQSDPVKVQCFPFYSIMLALNQSTIDFFSLDVEGDELKILETIPFEKLDIKMITAEVVHQSFKNEMQPFMDRSGYDALLKMQRDDGGVNDIIFRKKGLIH